MPISYTYKTLFVHIPKCAGTTIEKILGTCTPNEYYDYRAVLRSNPDFIKTPQHYTYAELENDLGEKINPFYKFSVVRNPYARIVSEYKYRKRLFIQSKRPEQNPNTFPIFVENLKLEELTRIKTFDAHLETQASFLKNKSGQIESSINIFRFEDMAPCWEMLKQKTGIANPSGYWSMRSMDVTPYKNFYTPELATTIYNFYKEDFDVLGYSKDL